MKKRIFALVMSVCMLISMMPVSAMASDHVHDASCGYVEAKACDHTHNTECGHAEAVEGAACGHSCADGTCAYKAAVQGTPCNHICNSDVCGYYEAIPGNPCNADCPFASTGSHSTDCNYSEGEPGSQCEHTHDSSCGYTAAVTGVACDHSHDSNCGYVEASAASPCTHTCADGTCGYTEGSECTYVEPAHTCEWGAWVSNNDGTHTHTCMTDASHTETESCATYSYAMVEGQPYHNILCECMYVLDTEDHTMSDWCIDGDEERRECITNCDYFETRAIETHTCTWEWTYDSTLHWQKCSDPDCDESSTAAQSHQFDDDTDATCDTCGYTRTIEHTHDWGKWSFNGDGTHTRVCQTDSSHTETGNCDSWSWSYKNSQEDNNSHWKHWSCDTCSSGIDMTSYNDHEYSSDTDLTCDICGYVRTVEGYLQITGSMPAATVGEAYSASFGYSGTVSGVVFWNATGLPDGLSIDVSTGTVSGTPTAAGTYNVTIAMGATGGGSANKDFTLTVNAPAHTCSFSAATCITPATCSCGATTGDVDKTNHTGGTEIRNAVAAGEFTEGYTGDTYCLGCNTLLSSGTAIPATHTHSYTGSDYDRNGHWKVCSCGATTSAEDHDWYIYKKDADKHYWRCDCGNNGWGNEHFDNNDTGKCGDCGYEMHTHDWKYRSVNDESHEPYCSGCEEVGIRSVHTYGNDGVCTVCGHTQHTHSWEYRIVNERRHEPYCTGCEKTGLQGMHTYGDDGACTACGYTEHTHNWEYRIVNESRHEPYCTECEETGLQGMHTWKYVRYGANTHQEVCTVCGYVGEYSLHENNNPDEDCTCDICGILMRHSKDDFSIPTCVSGYRCKICGYTEGNTEPDNHVGFSAATCTTPATCACGATEGRKNPTNHTGGTEIRNSVAVGELTEGYTGDTHCKGCGAKLKSGEVIPAKNNVVVKYTDDAVVEEVTFIASEGSAIPENAELVIDAYKAGVEQIPGSQHNDLTSVTLTDDEIEIITETSHTINGVTYTLYELIEINGTKYQIHGIHNDSFDLISLDSGDLFKLMFDFDGYLWRIHNKACGLVVLSETCKININGVEYDIVLKMTGKSKYDIWYLYYNGSPAGQYHSTNGNADFLKGYDPATLSGKQDNGDLGTITISNPPVADLTVGTTYNVTVVGSNDIHLENAENISGTLTQTFNVPDALVGNDDVIFVALHNKNPYAKELEEAENKMLELLGDNETDGDFDAVQEYERILARYKGWEQANAKVAYDFGSVALSEDGKTLTAAYTVDSFSPFIVYAFVEADEPECKTLSATIVEGEAASAVRTHTVVRGENLTDIARQYGCTVNEIVALNSDLIEHPSQIYVGWVLVIPNE